MISYGKRVLGIRLIMGIALANIIGIAVAAILLNTALGSLGEAIMPTVSAQQDAYITRRLDLIEQRFYGLESRLTRLEAQTRPSILPSQTSAGSDTEMQFFRTQVSGLRTRIGEAECALLKLDERTLTSSARSARAAAGGRESDKCRTEFLVPISLSARP